MHPPLSNIEVDKLLVLNKLSFNTVLYKKTLFLIYKSQLKTKSMSESDWIVIGISGVTCGGKTTLANRLRRLLVPVYILHQDKYFYPDDSPLHIKCEGLDHNNYDILSSLDMKTMHDDVISTIHGENKAHTSKEDRCPGKLEIAGKKFLILEGFTVLNCKAIMELCNLRYYFVLEYGDCFSRRCLRVYEPPDVPGYFEACVWPQHVVYRREIERDNRVTFIDGTRHDALEVVLKDLQDRGAIAVDS